jgi:hypothetical protein
MLKVTFGAVGARAGAASRYGSGSTKMMRLLAAPALKHWYQDCFSHNFSHAGTHLIIKWPTTGSRGWKKCAKSHPEVLFVKNF